VSSRECGVALTVEREWTSGAERDGQFIVTAVTDEVLVGAGSIAITLGSDLTVENRVYSLKIVSVTAVVDVDLVLFQKDFKTRLYLLLPPPTYVVGIVTHLPSSVENNG
jgi:hypothetical protein